MTLAVKVMLAVKVTIAITFNSPPERGPPPLRRCAACCLSPCPPGSRRCRAVRSPLSGPGGNGSQSYRGRIGLNLVDVGR